MQGQINWTMEKSIVTMEKLNENYGKIDENVG